MHKAWATLENEAMAEPVPVPSNCAICNLPSPSCTTFSGSGPTYLILVGDPGTAGRYANHNLGDGFNLAAQQQANDLNSGGNNVIACRVSSIQDVDNAMTQNGHIAGGVHYFGHSGPFQWTDASGSHTLSELFVGQGSGPDTNIGSYNIGDLANVDPRQGTSMLDTNAAVTLHGCEGAAPVLDYYLKYPFSIGELIANELQRGVYADAPGTYLSQHDVANATSFGPGQEPKILPNSLPMYLIPIGPPHHKPPLTPIMSY